MSRNRMHTTRMMWLAILELAILFGSSVNGQLRKRCSQFPVRISDSAIIADNQLTSSSHLDDSVMAHNARIGNAQNEGAWCAAGNNGEYLQVDLRKSFAICGIAVQGGFLGSVTSFQVATSLTGGSTLDNYNVFHRVFNRPAEIDADNVVFYNIVPYQQGQFVRFLPRSAKDEYCARIELYGFPGPKVSCNKQFMLAEFNLEQYTDDLEEGDMHLNDQACGSLTHNNTHVTFRIPLVGCGTNRQDFDDHFLYTNNVFRTIDPAVEPITTKLNLKFIIECFYTRQYFLDDVDFEVEGTTDGGTTNGTDDNATDSSGTRLLPFGGRKPLTFLSWLISLSLPAALICLLKVIL